MNATGRPGMMDVRAARLTCRSRPPETAGRVDIEPLSKAT